MSNTKIIGQILLWTAFLSAALASVCQRDFDFLTTTEQAALNELKEVDTGIPQKQVMALMDELFPATDSEEPRSIGDLDEGQFQALVKRLQPIMKQKKAEDEVLAAATSKPANELSVADLEKLTQLLPGFRDAAAAREKKEAEEKALLEAGEELPEKSAEQIAQEKKDNKPINRDAIIKKRVSKIENRWPTVPWLWYGLSMAVGIVGVVLLRKSSQSEVSDTGRVQEEYATIESSLKTLNEKISHLDANMKNMAPGQIVNFIDEECAPAFSDFADSRNALIQRFGLQAFADIMSQFASGERFMNRAWSASADGYMNEVRDCIDRAKAHLAKASDLLEEHASNSES